MRGYERFLGASTVETLPYFGGAYVDAPDRRLRLAGRAEPGFWRFEVRGRTASPIARADAPDLSALPVVRGHTAHGYVFGQGGRAELIELVPEEEPALFTPLRARRWPSGEPIFEAIEFESGAEDAARLAFEERASLAEVKGVPATARAAFAYAVVHRVAAERGVAVLPAEVAPAAAGVADGGEEVAVRLIARLVAEREARRDRPAPTAATPPGGGDATERAEAALRGSGAAVLAVRRLGGGLIEVRFRFLGERFAAIATESSLRIVDAGICLAGADAELTLHSLPSAIREAIDEDELVVTRHVRG